MIHNSTIEQLNFPSLSYWAYYCLILAASHLLKSGKSRPYHVWVDFIVFQPRFGPDRFFVATNRTHKSGYFFFSQSYANGSRRLRN